MFNLNSPLPENKTKTMRKMFFFLQCMQHSVPSLYEFKGLVHQIKIMFSPFWRVPKNVFGVICVVYIRGKAHARIGVN